MLALSSSPATLLRQLGPRLALALWGLHRAGFACSVDHDSEHLVVSQAVDGLPDG
jgi:hypothetical protein